MKKYNLEKFELSQAYLFFWDKIEKANWFLENVLETSSEDLDGRLVQRLLQDPVGDGGQWDMVANLVQKYGLVSRRHCFIIYKAAVTKLYTLQGPTRVVSRFIPC